MKRPSFQFYPGDWQRDPALRSCSVPARGLWIEMLCVMHQAEPYGHLRINGKPVTAQVLARMVGASPKEVEAWLAELQDAGVFSLDEDGGVFSRRMLRDDQVIQARKAGGKKGAEHGEKGAVHGPKGGRPPKQDGPDDDGGEPPSKPPSKPPSGDAKEPPLNPPPSSSSSSSTTSSLRSEVVARRRANDRPPDVVEALWRDFREHRAAKRSPVTDTVLRQFRAEADAAGITLSEAIECSCAQGWQGFRASWYARLQAENRGQANSRPPTRGEIFADQLRNGPARADDGRTIDVQATVADERPAPPHLALIRAGRF